jgi:LysM repeat protein
VGDRDTLTSVAARFDTTPSELKALNHLGGSFIYSGQTLLVPDKSKLKDDDCSSETSGDTEGSKDKSRKSSSNTDDIPQQEKGWQTFHFPLSTPTPRKSLAFLVFSLCLDRDFEGQVRERRTVFHPICCSRD